MQYLSILLVLLACNTSEQMNPRQAAIATTAVTTDTIVPATYQNGKLVQITKSAEAWKPQLSEMEYYVLREEGTERAFSGDLWNNHEKGTFVCAACGLPLFSSETKFESGTGWPSFYQPYSKDFIREVTDKAYGMERTEVECARCGGHQGHVFDDGPQPTGLRYCINSVSLNFVKK